MFLGRAVFNKANLSNILGMFALLCNERSCLPSLNIIKSSLVTICIFLYSMQLLSVYLLLSSKRVAMTSIVRDSTRNINKPWLAYWQWNTEVKRVNQKLIRASARYVLGGLYYVATSCKLAIKIFDLQTKKLDSVIKSLLKVRNSDEQLV